MDIKRLNSCCGVTELQNLNEKPKETIKELFYHTKETIDNNKTLPKIEQQNPTKNLGAFILFTDRISFKRGTKLTKYIKEKNIGKITETPPRKNPNTGKKIKIWIILSSPIYVHNDNMHPGGI